jgi:hypothetical protein
MLELLIMLLLMQSHEPSAKSFNNTQQSCEILSSLSIKRGKCIEDCSYYLARINNDTIVLVAKNREIILKEKPIYDTLSYFKKYNLKIILSPEACCKDSVYEYIKFNGVGYDLESNCVFWLGGLNKDDMKREQDILYECNTRALTKTCLFYYTTDIIGNHIKKRCIIE